MPLMSFEDVVTKLKAKKRPMSLLMGNGFSMAYDRDIFSYNALYNFLVSKDDELLKKLFGAIKTKNFELVMQQLDTTLSILKAFGSDPALSDQIQSASQKLKETLLNSVQELHPEHVFKVPDGKSEACGAFLSQFLASGGQIFTTNYDLLLYWVLLRQGVPDHIDGFGKEVTNYEELKEGAEKEYSDLFWGPNRDEQNVHFLHGALHLFDARTSVIKEQYSFDAYLLQNISARLQRGEYPIFVTAGTSEDKLEHIKHNQYLSFCYDKLSTLSGSLVTFGFNFGQYDEHIIHAINRAKANRDIDAKLWSIYIGVYTDADEAHIRSIEKKFKLKVTLFDAKTAHVWGS